MPRSSRFFLPDQPLHVIQRGNNQRAIFFAEDDRQSPRIGFDEAQPVWTARRRESLTSLRSALSCFLMLGLLIGFGDSACGSSPVRQLVGVRAVLVFGAVSQDGRGQRIISDGDFINETVSTIQNQIYPPGSIEVLSALGSRPFSRGTLLVSVRVTIATISGGAENQSIVIAASSVTAQRYESPTPLYDYFPLATVLNGTIEQMRDQLKLLVASQVRDLISDPLNRASGATR
jgi:hypothetical protein